MRPMQTKRGPGRPKEIMSDKAIGKRVQKLAEQGLSFGQMAKRLNVSRQYAHQVLKRLLSERAA